MTALLLAAALAAAPVPRVGAALVIDRPTQGPVVAVLGDVVVSSEVVGDVVAVGGDVELGPGAVVRGDVVALGGSAFGSGKATGRVVGLGSLGFGGRGYASRPAGSVAWGLGLLRVGLWVMVGSLLLVLAPRAVRGTGEQALRQLADAGDRRARAARLVRDGGAGAGGDGNPARRGVPALGGRACCWPSSSGWWESPGCWAMPPSGALPLPWRGELPRTGIALLVMTALSTVPVFGAAVWLVVNVVGVGSVVGALLHRYRYRCSSPLRHPLT